MTTPLETEDDFVAYDPSEQFGDAAGDVRDPYPDLHAERAESPVKRVDLRGLMGLDSDAPMPEGAPVFTVTGFDEVREVLSDTERFNSSAYGTVVGAVMGRTILEMDSKEHLAHRALVNKAFRPKMLERWSEELIGQTVDELLDRVVPQGRAELVRDLTFPFPVKVIARILGLPDSDWLRFQRWSIELISMGADYERGLAASATLREYFSGIVAQRRADPQDDLISVLVGAEIDGDKLTDEEIYSFLRLLLPAGAETTYRSSGNLLYGLLTHTDQLEAVRADRSLLPQAMEEALRWEPPLLFIMRTAKTDTEVAGVPVPAGSTMGLSLGGANRDPRRFPDPDRFDISRPPSLHMAFAAGPHTCLGLHLARLETRVLMNRVLDRLPGLRLDPAGDDPHIHGQTFRSPTTLPVLFDA